VAGFSESGMEALPKGVVETDGGGEGEERTGAGAALVRPPGKISP
jgi:hypothetical protein